MLRGISIPRSQRRIRVVALSGTVPSHREGRRLQWLQAGAEGAEQEEAVIQNASEAVALRAASTSALS